MSESANVQSLEALKRIRSSILRFSEDAEQSLRSTETELQMMRNWLNGRLVFWKHEIDRWREELEYARAELHRKRVSKSLHDQPRDHEQRDAVRLAERKLAEAEEMVEIVKGWQPELAGAAADYMGVASPLADRLTGDLETAVAGIDRMLDTLDKYVNLAAPKARGPASAPAAAAPAAAESSTVAVAATASDEATAVAGMEPPVADQAAENSGSPPT